MSELEGSVSEWVRAAGELLEVDQSEGTKRDIEEDVTQIYQLLKDKEEERIIREIEKEEEDIRTLTERIQNTQSEAGFSGEVILHDALSLYKSIKEEEWSKVHQIMSEQSTDSQVIICFKLINILKECYRICEQQMGRIYVEIEHEMKNPGETATGAQMLKKQKDKRSKQANPDFIDELLKKTGSSLFHHHEQQLQKDVMSSKFYKTIPPSVFKEDEDILKKYVTSCLEFSWLQILENKDIKIESNPKNLSKKSPEYKKIRRDQTLAWPALVDGQGCIVNGCDVELTDKNTPKPESAGQNTRQSQSVTQPKTITDESQEKKTDAQRSSIENSEEKDSLQHEFEKRGSRVKNTGGALPTTEKQNEQTYKLTGRPAPGQTTPRANLEETKKKQSDIGSNMPDRNKEVKNAETVEKEDIQNETKSISDKNKKANTATPRVETDDKQNGNGSNVAVKGKEKQTRKGTELMNKQAAKNMNF